MKLWPVHIYQHQRQCLSATVNFGITPTNIQVTNVQAERYHRRNFVGVHLAYRLGRRPPRRRLYVVFFSSYKTIRPWPLHSTRCPICYSLSTWLFRAIQCILKSWQRSERNHPFINHQLFDFGDVRCKIMYNTVTKVPPEVIWKTQASRERPIPSPKFNKYDENSPVSSDKGLFLTSAHLHSKSPNS